MIPFLLDLTDKDILVVGGGKIACRKIKQFINEKAKVKVIAPHILDEIISLSCECKIKTYETNDIKGAFLVCAATNDELLNEKIIEDAKKLNILTISITDNHSDLHSMKVIETKELLMGLSTKHTYPAFFNRIETDLLSYDEQLGYLCKIRKCILDKNLVIENERQLFFNQLMIFDTQELAMLETCLNESPYILVFTGELDETSHTFSNQLNAISLSYRDPHFSLKIKLLSLININWQIQPMVLSNGQIYQRIKENIGHLSLLPPLFIDNSLLSKLYHTYNNKRLFIIHPRGTYDLKILLQNFGEVIQLDEQVNMTFYDEIIPFILMEGYHYKKDIESLSLTASRLKPVLLKEDHVITILHSELVQRFDQ